MSPNIIITHPDRLNVAKQKIARDGPENFYVLSDFDKTLTTAFVDGQRAPSLVAILRNGNYLTESYTAKATALYDKYHAIEIDPQIPMEERKKAMREWWSAHFQLLIQSRLNIKDIENAVKSAKARLRQGVAEFLKLLHEHKIPLIILSSTGLGQEGISSYLRQADCLYDNIHILSNLFEWDDQGYAIGVKEPIIHSLNKNEAALASQPFSPITKNRRNVLVMGDSLDDVSLASSVDHTAIIKVGFLNEEVEKNLDQYKKAFDVLILNDGHFDFVNALIAELFDRAASGVAASNRAARG